MEHQAALRLRCAAAAVLVALSHTAHADGLEGIQHILDNSDTFPVPAG